ncbi:hypothetical protein GCM10027592_59140 [Spirosoma flavus]
MTYIGIDQTMFPWFDQPRQPFVMGLGSFNPPKQPDLAIRAIARIPEVLRPPLFWVGNIARKGYQEALHALSKELVVVFV